MQPINDEAFRIEDALREAWEKVRTEAMPPQEALVLWRSQSNVVYIEDQWGPAIPYRPVDHGDSTKNHGYRSLKGDEQAVNLIPEAQGYPPLQRFLVAVNRADSPVESVGCERGFFPVADHEMIKVHHGSYIDILFSDPAKNAFPENQLRLAAHLQAAVIGCERWWGSVEIGLQRLRRLDGCDRPWSLLLRVSNAGRSEDDALQFWEESVNRLGDAIRTLPANWANADQQGEVHGTLLA